MKVEYLYCLDHSQVEGSPTPGVALSCASRDATRPSDIGFEISYITKDVRREMVNERYEFTGVGFDFIDNDRTVYFAPPASRIWCTGKIVTQRRSQLSMPGTCMFELSDLFISDLREKFDGQKPIHKDKELAQRLAAVHVRYGFEMQFWPYLTPYESVCYLYGSDLAGLVSQVRTFFESKGLVVREVSWRNFPVY